MCWHQWKSSFWFPWVFDQTQEWHRPQMLGNFLLTSVTFLSHYFNLLHIVFCCTNHNSINACDSVLPEQDQNAQNLEGLNPQGPSKLRTKILTTNSIHLHLRSFFLVIAFLMIFNTNVTAKIWRVINHNVRTQALL